MQPSHGPAAGHRANLIQNVERQQPLRRRRLAIALPDAFGGSAEVADPAGPLAIRHIAKVPDQTGHAALIALRIANRLLDLRALLFSLSDIRIAPFLNP